jgi:hypothetical protein
METIEGILVGGVSAAMFGTMFEELPEKARQFVKDHPILVNAALTVATYYVLGGTFVASVAAGVLCAIISLLMFVPAVRNYALQMYEKIKGKIDPARLPIANV